MALESSDVLLIAAVSVGALIDVAAQVFLNRRTRLKLFPSIAAAFLAGGLATLGIAALVLSLSTAAILDRVALMVVVLTIYASFGFCLFALINLGETSLRLRILQRIITSRDPPSVTEVLAAHGGNTLISARLDRMVVSRQLWCIDGRYFAKWSMLLVAAHSLLLMKRLLYGNRSLSAPPR